MRIKNSGFFSGILLLAFFGMLLSCSADKAHLQIENSLPQNELAYYNDSFDTMREDLWDKAGYIALEEQMQNFKLADIRIENGKLVVQTKTDSYASTAISMEQIRSLSSRMAAKHIFYVMDSCYSGLGLNRSAGVWPGIGDYLRKVSSMRVVQIITAGGQGEQVQEREGHGLFTSYFLRAIEGAADLDKDNVVTGTELGAYLRPTVSNASRQAQTPLFGRLEGEGEFLFFVNPDE